MHEFVKHRRSIHNYIIESIMVQTKQTLGSDASNKYAHDLNLVRCKCGVECGLRCWSPHLHNKSGPVIAERGTMAFPLQIVLLLPVSTMTTYDSNSFEPLVLVDNDQIDGWQRDIQLSNGIVTHPLTVDTHTWRTRWRRSFSSSYILSMMGSF